MYRFPRLALICLLCTLCSCSSFSGPKKNTAPRKQRPSHNVEKSYTYRRENPLAKKYPPYQPLHEQRENITQNQTNQELKNAKIKKIVMIPTFYDASDKLIENIGNTAAAHLSKALSQSKNIIIEDTKKLSGILQEASPGKSKEDDLAISELLREQLGISSLITGSIFNVEISSAGNSIGLFKETKYNCQLQMELRIIDLDVQKIIFEERITGSSEKSVSHLFSIDGKTDYRLSAVNQAIIDAFDKILWKILPRIEKIGWKGKIAKVDRNKIYITGGQKTGLAIGDILIVSELGELIYNPDTKQAIGRAPGNIKGTIRIVDFFGEDGSITVINSGAGFKANDFVELQ